MTNAFSPEDVEFMKQQGINPDDYEVVTEQEPSMPEKEEDEFSPEDLEFMKQQGIDPTQVEIISQPLGTVAGESLAEGAPAPDAEEESWFDRFQRGVGQGIKETITPGDVTKEELERDTGLVEIAGELLGSMGIDLAAGAASAKAGAAIGTFIAPGAGTAVGGAIGGLVGLASYALFSGLAQEELAEKRTGEYSGARAAGRVALAMNPLLRYGGKVSSVLSKSAPKLAKVAAATEKGAVRAARLGAQVAGETAVTASEFGPEDAKVASAMSLILHGIAFKAGRKITPEHSKLLTEAAGNEDLMNSAKKSADIVDSISDEELMQEMQEMPKGFISWIAQLSGHKKLDKAKAKKTLSKMSPELQLGNYRDYKTAEVLGETIRDVGDELRTELMAKGSIKDHPFTKVKDAWLRLLDGQNAALELDNQYQSGITEDLNSFSEAMNLFDLHSINLLSKAKVAQKATKKAGVSSKEMGKLRVYLSEGRQERHKNDIEKFLNNEGNLEEGKVKEAVKAWTGFFDSAYSIEKSMGFNHKYVDTYVPRAQIGLKEKAYATGNMVDNVMQYTSSIDKKHVSKWNVDDLVEAGANKVDAENLIDQIKELKKLNKQLNGKKDLRVKDLANLEYDILESKNTFKLGNDVAAVHSRAKDITEGFREFDINKAAMNTIYGSVKTSMTEEPMRKLYKQYVAFNKAGQTDAANWVQQLMQDLSGETAQGPYRQMFNTKFNTIRYNIHKGMQNAKEDENLMKYIGWGTLDGVDQLMRGWQTAVYPAYLGLSVKSLLRNTSQNLFQTAPEMGGVYGTNVVARAAFNSPWKHLKRMKETGLLGHEAMKEAITDTGSKVGRAAGKINHVTMKLYTASDTFNRVWSYNSGHVLAQDLARGNTEAIKALNKLGAGVRTSLKKRGINSLEKMQENVDELGDILGRHLVAKTQFHYGKEQKAEFLRAMGPMFSMFTKWPVSITSDMNTIYRQHPDKLKYASRMFERYGAPLGLMMAAKQLMDEDDETMKYLVGDPTAWAPAMSVLGLGFFNSPIMESVLASKDLAKTVAEDPTNGEAIVSAMKRALVKIGKQGIPAGSALLNEIDKWQKAHGNEALSKEIVDKISD